MLPTKLTITLLIALGFYFFLLIHFMKKKTLSIKYTLLWLLAGVILALLIVFPKILQSVAKFLGFESPMNGLFVIAIGFMVILMISITSIVSRQSKKIVTLTQEVGILRKELEERTYREEENSCE